MSTVKKEIEAGPDYGAPISNREFIDMCLESGDAVAIEQEID